MGKRYPQAKIDEALIAYRTQGSYRTAAKQTGVPHSVIARWVTDTRTARYRQLCEQHDPIIEQQLVARMQAVADKATGVAINAVHATDNAIEANNAKDAAAMSSTVRNLMLAAGISTDKSQLLQGKPTEIHSKTGVEDDLKALARLFHTSLEGTAEDITPQPSQSAESTGEVPALPRSVA